MRQGSLGVVVFGLLCLSSSRADVFNIVDFGAVGDGETMNSKAIASTFSAASASYISTGVPATVLVPSGPGGGVYLSGQIVLASGVTLFVSSGARLLASSNLSDYPGSAFQDEWAFIYGSGLTGASIGGDGGVIDGNLAAWIGGFNASYDQYVPLTWPGCSGECRPHLVKLNNSTSFSVSSVTFTGSPDWTFWLLNCSFVHIFNWTQHGDERWPNNDGIDIDSSSHVLLEDSSIDTADDGVCIKGSNLPYGSVFNVTVRNVSVRSRSSAIKFGSNCGMPMHSLLFENITVQDSNRALALQARDGPGHIYDVTFRNIFINGTRFWPFKWWGDGGPIYISTMQRTLGGGVCAVSNITFQDIVAYSQGPAVLSGIAPGGAVDGVTLRNVTIVLDRWSNWNYSAAQNVYPNIEYDPSSVAHPTRIDISGHMPGVYVESVQNLLLENVNVTFNNAHAQPYWGSVCVNTSKAGFPVNVSGGSCTLPLHG